MTLSTFDPDNFPEVPERECSGEVTLPAWRLARLIERTEYAVDENSTRYALGGCVFGFENARLYAVATNGRSLAQAFEPASGTALIPPTTTVVGGEERPLSPAVPRYALKILASLLATMENSSITVGYTSSGTFEARGVDLYFSCRLLEGRFPEWRWLFPDEPRTATMRVVDPQSLLRALKEVYRFTVQGERATRLTLRRNCLTLTVTTGAASSELSIPVQNLSPERDLTPWVIIDPGYLLSMLSTVRAACLVSFPTKERQPLVFESDEMRFALMPMEDSFPVVAAIDSPSVPTTEEQSSSHSGVPTDGREADASSEEKQPGRRNGTTQKERPARVIRIRNVRANIWANRLENGQVIYNTTIERLWRDEDQVDAGGQVIQVGQWHQSPSFGRDDLLLVAKVADLAHTWIYQRLQDRHDSL